MLSEVSLYSGLLVFRLEAFDDFERSDLKPVLSGTRRRAPAFAIPAYWVATVRKDTVGLRRSLRRALVPISCISTLADSSRNATIAVRTVFRCVASRNNREGEVPLGTRTDWFARPIRPEVSLGSFARQRRCTRSLPRRRVVPRGTRTGACLPDVRPCAHFCFGGPTPAEAH